MNEMINETTMKTNGINGETIGENDGEEEEEEGNEDRNRSSSFLRLLNAPRNSVCNANTVHSISSFRSDHLSRKSTHKLLDNPNLFAIELTEKLSPPWIENTFEKRECVRFTAQSKDAERCGCGRPLAAHSSASRIFYTLPYHIIDKEQEVWTIANNTQTSTTDAFGTIVFQGGAHAHKAQYVRLSYDSEPLDVMYLMEKVWGLEAPRLVITVHGGMSNFELQERLGRLFRKGMLKAAQTTGAWIITSGLDSGVVRHVAKALDEAGISARMRSQIVTIGIAPWGVIKRKERLIRKNEHVYYDVHSLSVNANVGILNDRHSYFLLADNGTVGRFGADLHLRQNLENHIATYGCNGRKVPVVCTLLEGGISSINAIHDYVTMKPDIPAIVCDGSGRAADLISFAARYINTDGTFAVEVGEKLKNLIKMVFPESDQEGLLNRITECVIRDDLLRIFRYGEEEEEDVDFVILSTVLQKQNLPPDEQLALTLSWNRVDLAKSCLFSNGRKWPSDVLEKAMNDALYWDRVDFVECLLENGVSMKNFLTINRLENLYNMDDVNSAHSVRNWMENFDSMDPHTYLTIPMIGQVVEKLMGNAFQLYYTSRSFKAKYDRYKRLNQSSYFYRKRKIVQKELFKKKSDDQIDETSEEDFSFSYPFNDLLIWAVLTSRHEMAKCMWIHGEDAMAKCLVAIRLYKATAKIAEDEYLDVEEAKRLFDNAVKCREDAIELVDQCYRADHDRTLRLLRMELPHWGNNNCLSLAVLANTKTFLAHPCCQILLAELWHGSLKVRSGSNVRVLTALICPPAILFMAYKPKHAKTARLLSEETQEDIPYPRESITSTTSNRYRYSKGPEDQKETLLEKGNYAKKVTIISSRKNSGVASVYGSASSMMFKRDPQLSKFEKFRAFYSAPITKFWSWCIAFLIFLITQTCILLLETSLKPSKYEWILLIYTVTLSVEHMRKLLTSEGSRINEKIKVFYAKWYNIWTSAALIFFLVGYGFRLVPMFRHSWGRVLLSISNVLFYMKTFEYLSVHPLLGPYIQMAAKMVWSMCYIVVLLLVPLMAFGVNRQALTEPKIKDWNWLLVRNIFYKPYFMLYGEVYAGEIDTCGDEGTRCFPGYFIPPLLMVVFLLVANILLLNLLIAIFNNIYNDSIEKSKEIWLFQRYQQLMEYHDSPFLPPPFSIFAHVYHFIDYIWNLRSKRPDTKRFRSEHSIKWSVTEDEMKRMQDFEEDCIDTLTRTRRLKLDTKEPLNMTDLTELTCERVHDLMQENFLLKSRVYDIETKIDHIANSSDEVVQILKNKKISQNFAASCLSLPETSIEVPKLTKPLIDYHLSPVVIEERLATRSPLLANLHRDHTLRKYDDANFQAGNLQRRTRLHSSSCSISQDMKEMRTSASSRNLKRQDSEELTVSSHGGYDSDISGPD
ncbi:hypothetical protein B9Z55_013983 [Caenorhabditis nigoni]|uniref:TRPM SLOG domain-containing protein n=2 Tax=Caenorhabditis nigoni TaxID=1611254 RepID=A0A2G5U425_9PELO|nr:hypothetical protein B9Z55_013983 [Caenorhabditis nigoni]